MLVLSRKIGEKIHIGNDIVLTVVHVANNKVRLGIDAPKSVTILRHENVRAASNPEVSDSASVR
jgi:carbon storage regulator